MSNRTISTPNESSTRYLSLFQRYLLGALRQSLSQVKEHPYTVPEGVRAQAWHILTLTLDIDELWDETSQLLTELAPRMEMAGFREDWIPFLEAGIERSERLADEISRAELLYYLGQLYRLLSLDEQSKKYLHESAAIFAQLEMGEWQAKSLNELAYLAWHRSNVAETARYAEEALSLLPEGHIESAMAYSALGLIAVERFEYKEGEKYHRKALEIRQNNDDNRSTARSLQNLGVALVRQNRNSEADAMFDKAITLLETVGDLSSLGVVFLNSGLSFHYQGNGNEALRYFTSAELILLQVNDVKHLASLNVNKGLTYFSSEQFNEAEQCFERAAALFADIGNDAERLNATDGIIMVKIAQQKHEDAASLLAKAISELDRLPELPNLEYLTNSFANRRQILDGSGE